MLDRDRAPAGLLQRIVRMEEQLRQLRNRQTKQTPVEDWVELTTGNLGTGYAFDFWAGGLTTPSVYRDRDRVYAGGLLSCSTSDSDQPFASLPDGYAPAVVTALWVPAAQMAYTIPTASGSPGETVKVPNAGWLALLYPTGELFVQANNVGGTLTGLPQVSDELVLDGLSWRAT